MIVLVREYSAEPHIRLRPSLMWEVNAKAKETINPTNGDIIRDTPTTIPYWLGRPGRNVKANTPLSLGSHRASLPEGILMTVSAPDTVLRVAPGRKPPASNFLCTPSYLPLAAVY